MAKKNTEIFDPNQEYDIPGGDESAEGAVDLFGESGYGTMILDDDEEPAEEPEEEGVEEEPETEEEDEDTEESPEDEDSEEEAEEEESETNDEEAAAIARVEALMKYAGVELTDEELESLETEEDIARAVLYKNANNLINGVLNGLGAAEREAIELMFKGGKLEDILDIETTPEWDYTEDQLEEDVMLQERIIKEAWKAKGFTEKKITRLLSKLDEESRLEEAVEGLEELKSGNDKKGKRETIAERRARERAEAEAASRDLNERVTKAALDYYNKTEEIIPGKRINATTKKRLAEKVIPTAEKLLSNLEKYGPILAVLDDYGILDGKWDAVTAAKEATVAKKIMKKMRQAPKKSTNTKPREDVDDAYTQMVNELKRHSRHKF